MTRALELTDTGIDAADDARHAANVKAPIAPATTPIKALDKETG